MIRWILLIDLGSGRSEKFAPKKKKRSCIKSIGEIRSEKTDLPTIVPWPRANVCSSISETFGRFRKEGELPDKVRWELPADCANRLTFSELDQMREKGGREKDVGRESTANRGRQRKVVEYTPAEVMVGMDDETCGLIDARDVREHSVDRINLGKRRFLLRQEQLVHTHVF